MHVYNYYVCDCVYVCMYACMYILCVCMCVYVCVCVYVYVCIDVALVMVQFILYFVSKHSSCVCKHLNQCHVNLSLFLVLWHTMQTNPYNKNVYTLQGCSGG